MTNKLAETLSQYNAGTGNRESMLAEVASRPDYYMSIPSLP